MSAEDYRPSLAASFFEAALDMQTPEPQVPMSHEQFVLQNYLSVELDVIARSLARAWWIMCGKPADALQWPQFSPVLKQRYRYLAERAIATIDPQVRLDAQAETARDTQRWVDEAEHATDTKEIVNYAIGEYEALLAGVRAEISGNR